MKNSTENNKKKTKGKKNVEIDLKTIANKLGGKSFFILNQYSFQHLDINNAGQLFYNINDRITNQKWEFIICENANDVYLIKNVVTNFYLGSDSKGELYVQNGEGLNDFMKWKIYKTTENEVYVISNYGNGFYLDCNIMNRVYLNYQKDVRNSSIFYLYPKKIKK
jgi:hypothetical protein